MQTALLLLLFAADPFDFVKEPAKVEFKEEIVAAARADERDKVIEQLQRENAELREGLANYKQKVSASENNPLMQITSSISKLQTQLPPVQIVIYTNARCIPCKSFIAYLKGWLPKYDVSDSQLANFHIVTLSDEDWATEGWSLPHVVLFVRGKKTALQERDAYRLAAIYNKAVADEAAMPPIPGAEQVAGMVMSTIDGKQQVIQFLQMMEPFLDGGTLNLTYTAKPGVVKDYLTIKHGPAGIKIPSKTSLTLSMVNGNLTVTMQDPKPVLIIGPLERGIQEVNITPNKLSVRLPWMIDPELQFK